MSTYQITNQRDLRKAFRQDNPELIVKRRNGEYPADIRMAFVDYVDATCRAGIISEALAQRATL
jgi:hypothetical protein